MKMNVFKIQKSFTAFGKVWEKISKIRVIMKEQVKKKTIKCVTLNGGYSIFTNFTIITSIKNKELMWIT